MKILFCLIGWMNDYNGVSDDDPIIGGGSWVTDNGYGHEMNNFTIYNRTAESCDFEIDEKDIDADGYVESCCGFVMTHGQIHIEKLGASKNDDYVNGILVVWLATHPTEGGIRIVGWYEDATVYRWQIDPESDDTINDEERSDDNFGEYLSYNIMALADKCTIVDQEARKFIIPRATSSGAGIGQSQVWYALGTKNGELAEKVKKYIQNDD